jgi:hypothetical protein
MSQYTEKMIARLNASAPLNLEKAHKLAEEFGSVSYRSIIAKAKSLGLEYISKAPAAKRPAGPTKKDLVAEIERSLGLPESERDNLTRDALLLVIENLG